MAAETAKGWRPVDTFGTRLMLVRRQQQMSVEVAAATVGVKQASWSSWERGARPRDLAAVVAQVSDVLGVDRDWLMWGGALSTQADYRAPNDRKGPDSRALAAVLDALVPAARYAA